MPGVHRVSVSICTFVLIKQEYTFVYAWGAHTLFLVRGRRIRVSICTYVLVKQVNLVFSCGTPHTFVRERETHTYTHTHTHTHLGYPHTFVANGPKASL